MGRRYFGTDGIRGEVGSTPMTVDFALRLASAAARVLAPQGGTVLIGKDTRVSGYMFESALEAGFVAAGVDVLLDRPAADARHRLPHARSSAPISASSSAPRTIPYYDNGIKFFDAEGEKLSDELEEAIEAELARRRSRAIRARSARPQRRSRAQRLHGFLQAHDSRRAWASRISRSSSTRRTAPLTRSRPRMMADLGADVIPVGCSPNGRNINDGCGSTRPDLLKLTVTGVRAHVGIALDGDGDRVVMVDERGNLIDGDQLSTSSRAIARERRTLRGPVVGTVMTQPRARARAARAGHRVSSRPRSAIGTCSRCSRSAAVSWAARPRATCICLDRTTTGDGARDGAASARGHAAHGPTA